MPTMKKKTEKKYSFIKHHQRVLGANRLRRTRRVRTKLTHKQASVSPRLSVFRSNIYIYAQVIDDVKGVTLAHARGKLKDAFAVGEHVGAQALTKNVSRILYDRGKNLYHGHVEELAKGARKAGLQF